MVDGDDPPAADVPHSDPKRFSSQNLLKRIRRVFRPKSTAKAIKRDIHDSVATSCSRRSRSQSPQPTHSPPRSSQQTTILSYRLDNRPVNDTGIPSSSTHSPRHISSSNFQHDASYVHSTFLEEEIPTEQAPKPNALQEWAASYRKTVPRSESNPSPAITIPDASRRKAQRAQDLFGKYGTPLEPDGFFFEDSPPAPEQHAEKRVKKDIRVRIHHYCHRDGLGIGPNGVCTLCGHVRCRKCRVAEEDPTGALAPLSIGTANKSKNTQDLLTPDLDPPTSSSTQTESLDNWLAHPPAPFTQSATRTLASSLLAGPRTLWATRVVTRLCHECHSPFIWTETECMDCGHQLCSKCPRNPPLTPPGCSSGSYTSDTRKERVMKKPRIRVKYRCEACKTLFEENNRTCSQCGHTRCDGCDRFPPRTDPHPQPDPTVLQSLRARLDTFS